MTTRTRSIGSALVGILSLLLYFATIGSIPFPGEATVFLLQQMGLSPLESLEYPLSIALGRLLAHGLPMGSPILRLHAFNAFLGGMTVALMFWCMSFVPHNRTLEERQRHGGSSRVAQWISALFASLLLAVSAPFWFAATHTVPVILHAFLVMLLVTTLFGYARTGRLAWLISFAFLYGVSLVETASLYLFAPIFFVFVVILMWKLSHLRMQIVLVVGAAFALGFGLLLLHAWHFSQTATFEMREFRSYGHVVRIILRDQFAAASRGLPRVGWLTVGIFSVFPWFLLVAVPGGDKPKRRARFASYFLQVLLTVLAVALLANSRVSPWGLFGVQQVVLLPYLFVASWVGYLAGYWDVVFTARLHGGAGREAKSVALRRSLLVLLLGAGVAATGFFNRSLADKRSAQLVMDLARDIVDSLDGRTWLVTNGVIDGMIRYAAFEKDVPLRLLNLSMSQHPAYLRHVKTLFEDPRQRSLAEIGLGPLLDEWFRQGTDVVEQVAVLTHPDLWLNADLVPVPNRTVFLGARKDEAPAPASLLADAEEVWRVRQSELTDRQSQFAPLLWMNQWVASHYSKVANNLGVYCEDFDEPHLAAKAYAAALRIEPQNVSALLNQHLLGQSIAIENKEELDRAFNEFVSTLEDKFNLWTLSATFGYVRHPMAYLQRGWSWVLTGKPSAAIRDIEKAVSLGGSSGGLQLVLASLYFREGQDQNAEKAYFEALKENPEDSLALWGLVRTSMRRGDFDSARSYIARLLDLGTLPPDVIQFEIAAAEILAGNLAKGKELLETIAKQHPENFRVPAILVLTGLEEGDDELVNLHLPALVQAKEQTPLSLMVLAHVALRRNQYDDARTHLEKLLTLQPDHLQALEFILKLDVREGRMDVAEKHVRQLLQVDPRSALGNLVFGSIQFFGGEMELAESSFRVSLETQPSSEAWNSLAWLLYTRGKYDEALRHSRAAIQASPRNAAAWDTLGVSLMKMGRMDQAEQALNRAVEYGQADPRIFLHLAQLYAEKGERDRAREIAESLLRRGAELPREVFEEINALLTRI